MRVILNHCKPLLPVQTIVLHPLIKESATRETVHEEVQCMKKIVIG